MLAISYSPAIVPGWLDALPQPRASAIALLVGLAILTMAFLILVFTRWGQAKPLSKCLALSVFAHILLMAYAYGIQMFTAGPVQHEEELIQLTVVDTEEIAEAETEQPKPWENYATEAPVTPEPGAPSRQQTETALPLERDAPLTKLPLRTPGPVEPAPVHVSDPDVPVAPSAAPEHEEPPVLAAAPEIERPAVDSTPDPSPTLPPTSEPERLPMTAMQADPLRPPSREPNDDQDQVELDLQRLMELPLHRGAAEAIVAPVDDPQRARNQITEADQPANPLRSEPAPVMRNISDHVPRPADPTGGATDWELVAVRRSGDGRELPLSLRGRMQEDRLSVATRNGGNAQTEQAVEAALQWLAANQRSDGGWDCDAHGGGQETRVLGHDRKGAGIDADMAVTGLALLAFLGAGHTHLDGEYKTTVQRGLEYLLRQQGSDGNLAANARLFAKMYCHGMATLALGEALAMTGDTRLRPYLEHAIDYTIQAQHRPGGGWRYQPRDEGDTSQFGWQVMALRSAELGGYGIPADARAGMVRFLGSVSTGTHQGLASYRPGSGATRTMTAEALACRLFLELDTEAGTIDEAVQFVMQELPTDGPMNLYYWYYATLALFQTGGESWETWNASLQERLIAAQLTAGRSAGSWSTATIWGGYGGRVYTTAMGALCLEVYYRHLPVYGQRGDRIEQPSE